MKFLVELNRHLSSLSSIFMTKVNTAFTVQLLFLSRMNTSQLDRLPVELFHHVLSYFTAHEIFYAFTLTDDEDTPGLMDLFAHDFKSINLLAFRH